MTPLKRNAPHHLDIDNPRLPVLLQYIAFGFSAIIALNALLNLLDRLQGRFSPEDQLKLYREALKELQSERRHVTRMADTQSDDIFDNRITAEYPYPDIIREARRLRRFRRYRLASRHFWRYWFLSWRVIRRSKSIQKAVETRELSAANKAASSLGNEIQRLMNRLEEDIKRLGTAI